MIEASLEESEMLDHAKENIPISSLCPQDQLRLKRIQLHLKGQQYENATHANQHDQITCTGRS